MCVVQLKETNLELGGGIGMGIEGDFAEEESGKEGPMESGG